MISLEVSRALIFAFQFSIGPSNRFQGPMIAPPPLPPSELCLKRARQGKAREREDLGASEFDSIQSPSKTVAGPSAAINPSGDSCTNCEILRARILEAANSLLG